MIELIKHHLRGIKNYMQYVPMWWTCLLLGKLDEAHKFYNRKKQEQRESLERIFRK